jgi:hypothetical protein
MSLFCLCACVQVNHNFIKAVVPHLVPVLLQQLTKQEEGQEQDDTAWNLAMASGTCLGLLARTAQVCLRPLDASANLSDSPNARGSSGCCLQHRQGAGLVYQQPAVHTANACAFVCLCLPLPPTHRTLSCRM